MPELREEESALLQAIDFSCSSQSLEWRNDLEELVKPSLAIGVGDDAFAVVFHDHVGNGRRRHNVSGRHIVAANHPADSERLLLAIDGDFLGALNAKIAIGK